MLHVRPVIVALLLLACTSCVSRKITIESDPPGARVFLERKEIGTTPLTFDFEYGGVREFLLLHEEGETKYVPVKVRHDSEEFFLDTFPFDIMARVQPITIERDFLVEVKLEESKLIELVVDDPDSYVEALLNRAEQMRRRARKLQAEAEPAKPPLFGESEASEASSQPANPTSQPAK